MNEYDIREIINYKKDKGLELTEEETIEARKYLTSEQIQGIYRMQVALHGCYNLNNISKREIAAVKTIS
jgi:ribosomal protein L29